MYRVRDQGLEVLLAHPGGPFWRNKDAGAWSIPKGELDPEEDPLAAALREFQEETGFQPNGPFIRLQPVKQKGGKTVYAWAFQGDLDPATIRSNIFDLEWPPGSGRMKQFPEIDRAEFFPITVAKEKINPAQRALLEDLERFYS